MKFEDLLFHQKSLDLYSKVSQAIDQPDFKYYFFKDQMLRACLSISNNIAEGYERETTKELTRFLFIAKGSCGEVKNMLLIASQQG